MEKTATQAQAMKESKPHKSAPQTIALLQDFRRFNRFFSERIGLLNQRILGGPFTLAEARVIFEVGQRSGCTASDLRRSLQIDAGQLSRIVKHLAQAGYLEQQPAPSDGRVKHLLLLDKGLEAKAWIDARSDLQVKGLVRHLSAEKLGELVGHMCAIEALLAPTKAGQSDTGKPKIITVAGGKKLEDTRALFREYAASLPFDLGFQNFEAELAQLPGDYRAPGGCILLALAGGKAAGCVALRRIDQAICEMKRLYVRPEQRGSGLGRALAAAVIAEAKKLGCMKMRLDTVAGMQEAGGLYRSLGFREIAPYRFNPLPDAVYMELKLS